MSLWWYTISTFVHINVVMLVVALLPFPPTKFWKRIFDYRIFQFIQNNMRNIYFMMGCPSFLVFLDSVYALRKYSANEFYLYADPVTRWEAKSLRTEAQRNYFISGVAIVLCLTIPRLVSVLHYNAELSTKSDTISTTIKVFRNLIGAMQIEQEKESAYEETVDKNGNGLPDVSKALLAAIRKELEQLNKVNGSPENVEVNTQGLEELLREYDRKKATTGNSRDELPHQYQPRQRHEVEEHQKRLRRPGAGVRFGLF